MRAAALAVLAVLVVLVVWSPAQAQHHHGGDVPKAGRPADPEAPPGAPPHYIADEPWVGYHWVPFDEDRLHRLLRTDRAGLWRRLRDDTRTLERLAHARGVHDVRGLARRLVAPRRVPAAKRRALEDRALRVLTQGHLSQHLLFHTLHQDAGPEQAPRVFGVASTTEFQRLRRLDLSPLRIGRAHGRTRASMRAGLERALRAVAAQGVRQGDVSARQAAVFLQRQLRQVPRWLGEDHYNGPPETTKGKPVFPFRPSWSSPSLAQDGSRVVFDAAQPAPTLAVRFGEVNLEGRSLADGAALDPRDASAQALAARPCSSFNPSLSADGTRVAFELSAGNRTFAKRYGNVRVAVGDLTSRRVWTVAGGQGADGVVRTAYAPALSGDGRTVAYVEAAADPMRADRTWRSRVVVAPVDGGGPARLATTTDAAEPALSGGGTRVAYTVTQDGRTQVHVRDLTTGATLAATDLLDAWAPSLSADGSTVAFAARTRRGAPSTVFVRKLASGRTTAVAPGDEPSLAADGRTVAYSVVTGERPSASGRPAQRVDVATVGGAIAAVPTDGWSGQPSLSGDGTKVAFTTDAVALGAGGPGPGNLHVVVRDVASGTTSTANGATPTSRFDTGAGALDPGGRTLCAQQPPSW